ncbi:DHA1 family purine ribonucleoside efflux pump-like MFS transporter [Asanoa ferruginea]|uniref:DHA1 family purine ribonucleoside efflux pump-like MFS transporter n=1 Tax=Asanoa ferruginea TaxID=53367 RepID=A0A3D9ZU26_9ACTN|nr:MFS transporter [Asanoa ferruginea]REF99972.1 DHA1 family purine ribonucleoside efflux pump-like MFS transporter [Asanoa ferruginea]GIF53560.1 MFS transporter [Asanoa ferruginea]
MTVTSDLRRPLAGVAPRPARSPWFAVAAVGFGIFALVTTEFLPASLLPRIAADMGVSEGVAGQAVTATAIMGAITAPTIAMVVPRLDRRLLLVLLTGLAFVSNALVAVAPWYPLLLVARLLLGIAIAGYWAMALAVVGRLVSADKLGRAMTVVNLGVSLATVTAVPVGTYLGEAWGWRPVFWLAGAVAVVALGLLLLWLPSVAPSGAPPLRALVDTARGRTMILGMVAVLLVAGGHFAAFTYVRPAAERVPGITPGSLALLLTIFGVAAFVGTMVAGPLADRRLRIGVLVAPLLIGAAVIGFALLSGSYAAVVVAVAAWGLAFGGLPTLVLTWVARVEPNRLEPAGSLATAMFQVAIATGAAVGGVLVDAFDVRVTLVAAGIAAIAGGALFTSAKRF